MSYFAPQIRKIAIKHQILPKPLLATFSLFGLVGCGVPKDKNLPNPPQSLEPGETRSEAVAAKQKLWRQVTDALEMGGTGGQSLAAQQDSLQLASEFVKNAAKRSSLNEKVKNLFTSKAFETQCQSITSIKKVGPTQTWENPSLPQSQKELSGGNVYLIQYKLFTDANGGADANVRSGLVTLPTSTDVAGNAPLVLYAHGGDSGLSYPNEVARLFRSLQQKYIIIAPSYPGEGICNGELNGFSKSCNKLSEVLAPKQAGSFSEPYSTDAAETLGLHNCITKLSLSDPALRLTPPETEEAQEFTQTLRTQVKRVGGSLTQQNIPVSIMAGSSRGGGVAHHALIRAGAMVPASSDSLSATSFSNLALFQCAFTQYPFTTFAHASGRLLMEASVKNLLQGTPDQFLPSVIQMDSQVQRLAKEESAAQKISDYFSQRDASFYLPLLFKSVRNWKSHLGTTNTSGAWLTLHGALDRVVRVDQSQFTYKWANYIMNTMKDAGEISGVQLKALTLTPSAEFLETGGVQLKSGFNQHGDASYLKSTPLHDLTAVHPYQNGISAVSTTASSLYPGKTPPEILEEWLENDCKNVYR